jgi:hypothetical protein
MSVNTENRPSERSPEVTSSVSFYDAIVVLGGPVYWNESMHAYIPAEYTKVDQLGRITTGDLRIDGAVAAYLDGLTSNFVFSGGKTPPLNRRVPIEERPTEAAVFEVAFERRMGQAIAADGRLARSANMLNPSNLFQDPFPLDTEAALYSAREIAIANEWLRVGIMSDTIHGRRVREDINVMPQDTGVPYVRLEFLPAEPRSIKVFGMDQVKKLHDAQHGSGARGFRRAIEFERQGIKDKRDGRYRAIPKG